MGIISYMKRIALVRLTALGDIINSVIVLQLIKKHYPDVQIEWICEEAFAPILFNHPGLHAVHTVAIKRIKKEKNFSLLKETIQKLRDLGTYDLIIDMQGLLKSAITARFIGKNIHGYDRASAREGIAALLYQTHSHIPYNENIIRRNCRLVAEALNFTVTDQDIRDKKPVFAIGQRPVFLSPDKPNIALVIGASWPSKIYPKEHYAALCKKLDAHFIILWGNETERKDASWIAAHAENAYLAPKLSLSELTAFIAHTDLTIGSDTGPTHLAWALNRPSITLFGPTTPRMIFETAINLAIESDSTVDINHIDKNDFSIRNIDLTKIAATAKELL